MNTDAMRQWSTSQSRTEAALINAVIQRLEARARMATMAREIVLGLRPQAQDHELDGLFVGEQDRGHVCGPPDPKGTASRYECSANDHSCTAKGGFKCASVFGNCGGSKDSYDCKKSFDCGKEFYDCHDFNCGQTGEDAGSYNCNEKVDFICGGPDFDCVNDFDCTAGHIFFCLDNHECEDSFNCKATGSTACNKKGGLPYSRGDDSGTDKAPGDFVCGYDGFNDDGGEDFTCTDDFDCSAANEFDCHGQTDFDCAVCFDCGEKGSKMRFECDKDFDCQTAKKFTCVCTFAGTDKTKD